MDKEKVLAEALLAEQRQLDAWADQSERGGWSTHQVEPMRKRAAEIRDVLWRCGYGPEGKR